MKYRELGQSGIRASVVGLGTWAAGGGTFSPYTDDADAIRAIETAIDNGVNLIDTAPAYGFGHAEELVGKTIVGKRDKVVIATKCGLWWGGGQENDFAFELNNKRVYRSLSRKTIAVEVDNSLRRLGTDYIDLYQTHWPERGESATPIAETMDALMALKKAGKIRAIGACNVDAEQIEEYQASGRLDAVQNHYSLLDRCFFEREAGFEKKIADDGIAMLAWSPLEQGLLTGKIRMEPPPPDNEYRACVSWFKGKRCRAVSDLLAGWNDLLERYDCTMTQLVIAWTVNRPVVTHALVGSRRPTHSTENSLAGDLKLSPEDCDRMNREALAVIEASYDDE